MHSNWAFGFLENLVVFGVDFPNGAGSLHFSYPLSSSTSISFPFPLFLGPLVIPVNSREDALGYVSSFPHSSPTLPRRQRLVIVARCGINPLHLLMEWLKIDFSIIFPTFILYHFSNAYRRIGSSLLTVLRCFDGKRIELMK